MPTTRAPSITRLFAATFIAVALVGLVTQIATWRSARATQAAMVEVAQRLPRTRFWYPPRQAPAALPPHGAAAPARGGRAVPRAAAGEPAGRIRHDRARRQSHGEDAGVARGPAGLPVAAARRAQYVVRRRRHGPHASARRDRGSDARDRHRAVPAGPRLA